MMSILPIFPNEGVIFALSRLEWARGKSGRSLAIFLPFFLTLLCLTAGSGIAQAQDAQERRLQFLQDRYDQRRAKFEKEMQVLATDCETRSFFSDAETIRKRSLPPTSSAYNLDKLPATILPPIPATLPEDERLWRTKQRNTESDFARDLYKIARDALRDGYPSLTYQLVREVAFHDPDNRYARSMLGYVQDKDQWTTPFVKLMSARGQVDHPQFGWIPAKYATRYEAGERFFDGRWMSAEKEAAIRTDVNYAWSVSTEHFEIKTNHSLEKGVEISRKLEVFYDFFMREYAAFFNSRQQMEKLLDLGPRAKWDESSRYRVNYYKTKDEFVSALKARQPQIERATGLYLPADHTAYFYYQDPSVDSETTAAEREGTMYHEVTHQLLGLSRKGSYDVGEGSDFWVVEGFASYMETFNPDRQGNQVGDPRHIRIFWARRKIVEEDQYYPMRGFTAVGRESFPLQAEAYNQSSAMVHFLLNYNEGEYRDAFIQYLANIYDPLRKKKPTLEEVLKVRFESLDAQFTDYLKTLPSDPPPGVNVIIGR